MPKSRKPVPKSQKELSRLQQEPYVFPETEKTLNSLNQPPVKFVNFPLLDVIAPDADMWPLSLIDNKFIFIPVLSVPSPPDLSLSPSSSIVVNFVAVVDANFPLLDVIAPDAEMLPSNDEADGNEIDTRLAAPIPGE